MNLNKAEYRAKLEKVVEELKDSTTFIDIRGNGAGQFIYARNDFRAIELSQSTEGVWIEFWNETDETPINETTVSNYKNAVKIATDWLNSH